MSSGTPESGSPQDWQSPYTSQGGHDPHGGGYGAPGHSTSYDPQYGPPGYPPQDRPPYTAPGQAPYDPQYGTQGQYDQYGAPAQGQYDQYGRPYASQPSYEQPYGAPGQPPYGQPGYGAQPGYGQPPGYGPYQPNPYGYPAPPVDDGPRTHAIIALVISIVMSLSCYVTLGGIAGVILSAIALSKAQTEPQRAKKLLPWVWISIGINVVLIVLFVVVMIITHL
ncbi:DUF4190 domain-containing protein [Sphaerisporangium fuscum]|uniref:DUF4190 domain-containing protein n=1 Tax=Sphaerisporangium fuscum TaxID=2835868 RepID=UPI001BDC1CAB|nr:DUF4190 domain-containing protein [Sphaerisporangium fuscum]